MLNYLLLILIKQAFINILLLASEIANAIETITHIPIMVPNSIKYVERFVNL